jgi:hypothetical protein
MNDLEKYLIITIVVWRLTHLFSAEDGPFDIIIRFRKLLGNSVLGKLMDCFYCLSVWIGLVFALFIGKNAVQVVMLTLFYSGAAILAEKITNKNFI